jgi:hypothetical protein
MPSDIVELQHQLSENRADLYRARTASSSSSSSSSNKSSTSNNKYYRSRTAAAIQNDKNNASELLELGVSIQEVSELVGIHPSELARIEEDNQRRRKFLMTGNPAYI